MPSPCKKDVELSPLSGPMNTRVMPKDMPAGAWRWRQNLAVDLGGNTCRRPGWTRFLPKDEYNNEDLHDQGQGAALPDPIVFLWEAITTGGSRRVIAGTAQRLFSLEPSGGVWQNFYTRDEPMPEPTSWQMAQGDDLVVVSNQVDPVFLWAIDSPAITEIESLSSIGLTRAAVLYSWKGVVFLGDVTMDGERIPHRVVWSDFNVADFDPATAGSIAGFQDLSFGERILRFLELGDYLLIYTTRGIWQVTAVGGDAIFNFRAAYADLQTATACLVYPNTLASTGQSHIYLGSDGLYEFDLFKQKPERPDWMHASSNIITETLDQGVCVGHVASYFPACNEYMISWVEKGMLLPVRTLAYNTTAKTSDLIDHGFTALFTTIPDLRPSLENVVRDLCLCSQAEFEALMVEQFHKLHPGDPLPPDPLGSCVSSTWDCQETFSPAYTTKTIKIPGEPDGPMVEDPYGPENGDLCAYLNEHLDPSLCVECATRPVLIMASAEDFTLKEVDPVEPVPYREVFDGVAQGCGKYSTTSYQTIGILGPQNYGLPNDVKSVDWLEVEYYTVPSGTDLKFTPSIASSEYAAETVDQSRFALCPAGFRPLSSKAMVCKQGKQSLIWVMHFAGRYLSLKFVIEPDKPKTVGGPVCLPIIRLQLFSNARWPRAKE